MTCHDQVHETYLPAPRTCGLRPAALFSTLFAEVITPDGQPDYPAMPDWEIPNWEVRVWPVARLGDATLEARARFPHLTPEHLKLDLQRLGVTVLGPVRHNRS